MAIIVTNVEMLNKIKQIKELEELIKEAKAEVEALKSEIKEEMVKLETEEMAVGCYVVRYKTIVSNKFDSSTFKSMMPEVYKAYTKPSIEMRFSIK